METRPIPYETVILVCTNQSESGRECCAASGSEAIRAAFKSAVEARGLKGRVRVSATGCLGRCSEGPNVFVLPESTWFSGVSLEDVPGLLDRLLPPCDVHSAPGISRRDS